MNDGDFVQIEFVGRVKDTGELFDLTDEALAKKEGVYQKENKYGPTLVILGARSVIPGVESQIKQMKVGDEKEFDVSPENGFGMRDPKFVQIISLAKFIQQKVNPVPGAFVNIDGRNGKIQSVSGGRIRVDFNHPLANKTLLYKLKVVKDVKDSKEKMEALLKYFSIDGSVKVEGDKCEISLKQKNKLLEKLVEETSKKWIKEIRSVTFSETKKTVNTEGELEK